MAKIAPQLEKNKDYEVDEKNKNVILTEEGIDKAQELLEIQDLFDINNQYAHHLLQAFPLERNASIRVIIRFLRLFIFVIRSHALRL